MHTFYSHLPSGELHRPKKHLISHQGMNNAVAEPDAKTPFDA
jgi:hypothetical protein